MISIRRLLLALFGLALVATAGVLGYDWTLAAPALETLPGRAREVAESVLTQPVDRYALVGLLTVIGLPLAVFPRSWIRAGAVLTLRSALSVVGVGLIWFAVAMVADGALIASAAAYGAPLPSAGPVGAGSEVLRYAVAGAIGVVGLVLLIAPWRRGLSAL